jgi:hypothetical protein
VDSDALPPGHELDLAIADLRWLAGHGASTGVREIIRERRRQIEKLGYAPERDAVEHANGMLLHMARHRLVLVDVARDEITATPVSDDDGLRKGGALVAAELDRLTGTSP